ncbi:MAG: hypothetical protein MPF33_05310 [Candidatus Aramenus sp.]|nr:hypothetical protein [Candidatus Aramenus sp.]
MTEIPRGVDSCPLGRKLHSDVNSALDIIIRKIINALALSFLFTSRSISLKGE